MPTYPRGPKPPEPPAVATDSAPRRSWVREVPATRRFPRKAAPTPPAESSSRSSTR